MNSRIYENVFLAAWNVHTTVVRFLFTINSCIISIGLYKTDSNSRNIN